MNFGLTFEKLIVIGVIAAMLIGPERLPRYAEGLAALVRRAREFVSTARERVSDEMGDDFKDVDWRTLDPRQYDPRRIIREALLDDTPPATKPQSATMAPAPSDTTAPDSIRASNTGVTGALSAFSAPVTAPTTPPYDTEAT